MTSSTASLPKTPLPESERRQFTRGQSIALVFCCTILGAAAQIFMKTGVNQLNHLDPIRIVTNLPLLAGYSLYGINTLLLMLALRDGELSVLYPIIALSYVWVAILSIYFFEDRMNPWKISGIFLIIAGVTILGRSGRK
ncbi:MAG: EamA family transporter [Acidobacteriota bacterium]|nr:EamA family transporter [Acidobacteriota bacterium]